MSEATLKYVRGAAAEIARLRAENERLRARLIDEHDSLIDTDHALHMRELEVERLRGRNKTLEERLDQILILANPLE